MEQGILVLDAGLNIRMWNGRITALFDLPRHWLPRRPADDRVTGASCCRLRGQPREDAAKIAASRLALFTKRELLVLSGADAKGASSSGACVRMPDGGFVATYTDITERRQREDEIAEKSALLAATLDNMDQGLVVVDANDRAKLWNNRLIELFKLPPDVMQMGRPMSRSYATSSKVPAPLPDRVEAAIAERMAELHGEPRCP